MNVSSKVFIIKEAGLISAMLAFDNIRKEILHKSQGRARWI